MVLDKLKTVVPRHTDLFEFIKNKDIEWFESEKFANKFKFDNEDYPADDVAEKNENKEAKKNKPRYHGIEGPITMSLRKRPHPIESKKNNKTIKRNNAKRNRKHKKKEENYEDSKNSYKESVSESEEEEKEEEKKSSKHNDKSESSYSEVDDAPSETRFTSAICMIPNNSPDSQKFKSVVNELYKVDPPMATILPFNTIGGALSKLINDLSNFNQRMESDYSQRAAQLDADNEIGTYWRELQKCSMSLLHIVNDIMLLHQHNEIMGKENIMQDLPIFQQQMCPMVYPDAIPNNGIQFSVKDN